MLSDENLRLESQAMLLWIAQCDDPDVLYREWTSKWSTLTEHFRLKKLGKKFVNERLAISEEFKNRSTQDQGSLSTESPDRYFLLTSNPRPDADFYGWQNQVFKFVRSKGVKDYSLVFEQRGKDSATMGQGFHCHILYRSNVYASNMRNRCVVLQSFSGSGNNRPTLSQFRIDEIPFKNLHQKIRYVHGVKESDKMGSVVIDRIWRKSVSLEDVYTPEGGLLVPPRCEIVEIGG